MNGWSVVSGILWWFGLLLLLSGIATAVLNEMANNLSSKPPTDQERISTYRAVFRILIGLGVMWMMHELGRTVG